MSFPCLGISELGHCLYNPRNPPIYFGLGDAIAALAFTLTAQQLLKPVFRFRLAARSLSISHLYALVFMGVLCIAIAAILPSAPPFLDSPLSYPIFWEIVATGLFLLAYLALAWAIIRPVKVKRTRIERFSRAAAALLSSASERDCVDFSPDLALSLGTLTRESGMLEWRREFSAFYEFTYRHKIRQAEFASSILRVFSDRKLTDALVSGAPWVTATMVSELSADRLHSRSAEVFIQRLAYSAVGLDASMLERESGYHGFATAPLLKQSLFSDSFILNSYDPFGGLDFIGSHPSAKQLERYASAAEAATKALVENRMFWHVRCLSSIQSYYRSASTRLWTDRDKQNDSVRENISWGVRRGATIAINAASSCMLTLTSEELEGFYASDPSRYRNDLIDTCSDIVFDALQFASNGFSGPDDPYWFLVHDIFHKVFPGIGAQPNGMNPLQQLVARKLIEKLRDNLNGFYPSISRILIACIGPHRHAVAQENKTAFNILKDAVYNELAGLKYLHDNQPGKFQDYLPENASYDPSNDTLLFRYRSGDPHLTKLDAIKTPWASLETADVRPDVGAVPELEVEA